LRALLASDLSVGVQPVPIAETTSPAQPSKRPTRKRKTTRASFGSVRRLPSGRYQARYSDERMNRHTAPHTFETKTAAEEWLATIRADVVSGTWRAPELGKVTVADFAARGDLEVPGHAQSSSGVLPWKHRWRSSVGLYWLGGRLRWTCHGLGCGVSVVFVKGAFRVRLFAVVVGCAAPRFSVQNL